MPILKFCKSRIYNKSDAEDICQNVLSILSAKSNDYDANKSFYSWSFRICNFQIKGYLSKKKRNLEDSYEYARHIPSEKDFRYILTEHLDPAETLSRSEIKKEKQKLINDLIKRLPPKQESWYLNFMKGKSKSEIKQIMGISEYNYNSLRYRTIQTFRNYIKNSNTFS